MKRFEFAAERELRRLKRLVSLYVAILLLISNGLEHAFSAVKLVIKLFR